MLKFLIIYDKQNPIQTNVFKVSIHYPLYLNLYTEKTLNSVKANNDYVEMEIEKQLLNAVLVKNGDEFIYQEDTFTEKPNYELIERKNVLILTRNNQLRNNDKAFIEMFRDFLLTISASQDPASEILIIANQNKQFCEDDKRVREEIEAIKNANSLEDLAEFE